MQFTSYSLADTAQMGRSLAALLRVGDSLALSGDLGAGKTELARAVIRALSDEGADVPSPTFNLVQPYDVRLSDGKECTLWHYDLYRIENPEELVELGMNEVTSTGVAIIEWPERAEGLLPPGYLAILLRYGAEEGSRVMELIELGNWQDRLKQLKVGVGHAA